MTTLQEDAYRVYEQYRETIDHLAESDGADRTSARILKILTGVSE